MFSPRLAALLVLVPVLATATPVAGQIAECRPFLDGPRLPLVAPDPALRSGPTHMLRCDALGLVAPTPATVEGTYRSAYPFDRNDGPIWTGRGFSSGIAGGFRVRNDHFLLVAHPVVAFQQNRDFVLAGKGGLQYPFHTLDWPQQPERGAFWTLDPGQSELAVMADPVGLSVSTGNLWWGPARRYPLLLGNTAPGFPHLDLGTTHAVGIGIGSIDTHLMWGRLDESASFDADPENDHRLLAGAFLEFDPYVAEGLSIGVAGLMHSRWEASSAFDLFSFPFQKGGASTVGNGLLSVEARWHFAEIATDVYAEWGREDYWADLQDFINEPDHSQAYLLGFERVMTDRDPAWRLSGELIHLGASATSHTRGLVTYYEHGVLTQGHTNRGQLLGASIGPGSDAQYLAADLLFPQRTVGVYLERIRHDDDAYYLRFGGLYGPHGHDVEMILGVTGEERSGKLHVEWEGSLARRRNRGFIGLDGVSWDFRHDTNLALTLRAWWAPSEP